MALYSSCTFLLDSTPECCSHTLDQSFIVKWFRQELHGARPQGLKAHFFIAMCRDKDGRNFATVGIQPGLQLQTGHSRHANIRNQTRRLLLIAGPEKCLCRMKSA